MPVLSGGGRARRALRLATVVLLALTLVSTGHSALTHDPVRWTTTAGTAPPTTGPIARGSPAVVATVDGVGPGQIVAFDDDGDVTYWNDSLFLYHDVDPSPAGDDTVTYVASDVADDDACAGDGCLRNVIERVNLTTGDVTRIHAWVDARNGSTQTHDVDRVNDSTFLVADISYPDRVYMVNTTTGEEVWEWRVSAAYEPESGGSYPGDWTHVNDVEHLPDGRVMVNLRNQDQVVFIEPGEGIQSNWTLGTDGDHETLYEPHNPDYIPEARGGPAVVIADSENNRLVEYERENGTWNRTWHWQDTTMQWPRDADRLPSGRTLVADSHGQRLLSVERDGTIAWSRSFPTGSYDVELLGTGDESAGGESAKALDLRSRWPTSTFDDGNTSMDRATVGEGSENGSSLDRRGRASTEGGLVPDASTLVYGVVSLVPPLVLHGLLYALPSWATATDAVLVLLTSGVAVCWLGVETAARLLPRVRSGWSRRT